MPGSAILSAYFVVFPVFEIRSNSKHLQLVSGVDRLLFWVVALITDFILFSIALVGIVTLFGDRKHEAMNSPPNAKLALALLLVLFGWATIPLAYLVHRIFSTEVLYCPKLCFDPANERDLQMITS